MMDDDLARNLVAMWQSELTAMAADRELHETWIALLARMGNGPHRFSAIDHGARLAASGAPNAAQPPRSAPVAAASDAGGDEIERLSQRVAELERRLAEFCPDRPG